MADEKLSELSDAGTLAAADLLYVVKSDGGSPPTYTSYQTTLQKTLNGVNVMTEDTSPVGADDFVLTYDASASAAKKVKIANLGGVVSAKQFLEVAASDEATSLTVGDGKITFYWPGAGTLVSCFTGLTAQSSSGVVTIDVEKNGSTIFTTKPSIDASEDTSITGTAAVLSSTSVARGDKFVVNVDAAGTGAKGLKVIFEWQPS